MIKFDLFSYGTNSDMSFSLFFPDNEDCDELDNFDEGVEFAFRLSSAQMEWIPIVFIYPTASRESQNIPIGTLGNLSLRGYHLEMDKEVLLQRNVQQEYNYSLCAPQLTKFNNFDYIQFRWLQTSFFNEDIDSPKDAWSLDNVTIDFVSSEGFNCTSLEESFENSSIE